MEGDPEVQNGEKGTSTTADARNCRTNIDLLLQDVEIRTKEGYKHGRGPSGL